MNHTPVRAGGWPFGAALSSTEAGQLQDRILKSPNADDGSTHNGSLSLGGVQAQHITGKEANDTTAATAGPHAVTVDVNIANQHFITVAAFAGDQTLNITIDAPRVGDQGIVWVKKANGANRNLTLSFIGGSDVDAIDIAPSEQCVDNDAGAEAITQFFWECLTVAGTGNVVRIRNEGTRLADQRRVPAQGFSGLYDPRLHTKDFPPTQPDNEGHFGGSSSSIVREDVTSLSSASASIHFWQTPSTGVFIIEGVSLELKGNITQSGTPEDMMFAVEVEREPNSARYFTLARARIEAAHFVAGVYDVDEGPAVWGLNAYNPAGVSGSRELYVEAPMIAWGERLYLDASSATDTFWVEAQGTTNGIAHGLANGDKVRLSVGPGGVLPTGVVEDTSYFVVGAGTADFSVSATFGGAAINITTNGTQPYYAVPLERGIRAGQRGLYVGSIATRFRGSRMRVRGYLINGTPNTWSASFVVGVQLRMVR